MRALFGDRPPLHVTLTGGRPPGRKVPDPNWGLDDNKRKLMGGEIATVPENRSGTYCGDVPGAFLVVGDWH